MGQIIDSVSLLPGCSAGLDEKTALLSLRLPLLTVPWELVEARLRAASASLYPQQPLHGVAPSDWPGAFVSNATSPADLAQWIVALAVALQRWAQEPVSQGRVLAVDGGLIRLALPWEREPVFKSAVQQALQLICAWSGDPVLELTGTEHSQAPEVAVRAWLARVQAGGLAPNSIRFVQAARARQIPVCMQPGYVQLGWGARAERFDSSFTGRTSNIAARMSRLKHEASRLLSSMAMPVPRFVLVSTFEQALQGARRLGWPVVIKPSNQDQGTAVVPGIRGEAALRAAFEQASRYSPGAVLLEQHVAGDDFRLLVVGGKMLMATQRVPAGVQGDGRQTVRDLVEQTNRDPWRGRDKRSLLISLELDSEADGCLAEQGLQPDSVPEPARFVRLRRTANISTGGTARDVTARVHPDNRALAERATRIMGLDIAGVDFLCPDISRSWREVGGAICEINAQPGFRVHWLGEPGRDINGEVLDQLLPDQPLRIPTAAITGTNGKSTVAMMLHHIWLAAGRVSGVTTTAGTWVGRELVTDQNLSGYPGARQLLLDPAVEAAVLEMPRKGLIVFGHACDRYDVAALLNVQDDHIGADGIVTMEQMAELKAEVLERATQAVVVNAEDERCLAMRARAACPRHILVASDDRVPALRQHLEAGGEGVFVQRHERQPWIVLARGAEQNLLMPLHDIPATMDGLLRCNVSNALFAVALAWAQALPLDTIRTALAGFHNSLEQNPGRYNFIEGFPFRLLLDFGHNPDGARSLCELVTALPVGGRRHLLNQKIGNRYRAHFAEVAPLLAQTFDRFVLGCAADYVRQCPDYAGEDPVAGMLAATRGLLLDNGVAAEQVVTEADAAAGIRQALAQAGTGDLVVLLAEPWIAWPVVRECLSQLGVPLPG